MKVTIDITDDVLMEAMRNAKTAVQSDAVRIAIEGYTTGIADCGHLRIVSARRTHLCPLRN